MSSKKFGRDFLKGVSTFRVTSDFEAEVIEKYLQSLDCPRALTVAILFREGEHEQLSELEFNPSAYSDVNSCRDAYAATKFLSKFTGLRMNRDLNDVAFEKFEKFEQLCKHTNLRFRKLESDRLFTGRTVWLHNAIIRKISTILGEFSVEDFFSMPDWGPGASTLIKRRDANPAHKFQCETGITRDLYDLIPIEILEASYPLWSQRLREGGFPTFQVGNKVITVPKDASTNRVIAIEPGINLWFQSSIGDMIGKRLLRYGIDLRWQSRNQQLALKGSLSNLLATVDLSSASDSISCEVVEALLPHRWYQVMDSCRSHYGSQNGRVVRWNKFSSMGNGFTFQLESLIFYAIAACCAEYLGVGTSDVSSYGDDIILPSSCFEVFSEMMAFYGFLINAKKSHFDSPFRESCGAHYYSGVDIKPIYLKDRISSVLSIYRLANAVRRLAHRRNVIYGCDQRLRSVFELLYQKTPKGLRLKISEGYGDGGFIMNFDEATPSKASHGLEGYKAMTLTELGKTKYDETSGYLLAALWSLEGKDNLLSNAVCRLLCSGFIRYLERRTKAQAIERLWRFREVQGRNSVPMPNLIRLRLSKVLVHQWYDLGPWI